MCARSGADMCPASHDDLSVNTLSFVPEVSSRTADLPANLTSGGMMIPATVPHTGPESSKGTAPLCEDGI